MAAVTPKMVKELREKSGAGMMDCKKALSAANGDIDLAMDELRKAGLGKAAKKSGNVAAEGLISVLVSDDNKTATITEVNSQTDFVAKNENFQNLTKEITAHVQSNSCTTSEELSQTTINGVNFTEYLNEKIATIGENIVARRMATLSTDNGVVNGYVHANGRVGVILAATCKDEVKGKTVELLKNVAMHAAAMKPTVISYKELDAEFVAKENEGIRADIEKENEELVRLGKPLKRIPDYVSMSQLNDEILGEVESKMKDELKAQGKPEKIWDRIIPGQIERYVADNTKLDQQYALLSQFYVMDDKKTVEQAIKDIDDSIEIVEYIRLELGEGIEKKEEDFAAEVAKQMGN
jgi:elongation factor Ts